MQCLQIWSALQIWVLYLSQTEIWTVSGSRQCKVTSYSSPCCMGKPWKVINKVALDVQKCFVHDLFGAYPYNIVFCYFIVQVSLFLICKHLYKETSHFSLCDGSSTTLSHVVQTCYIIQGTAGEYDIFKMAVIWLTVVGGSCGQWLSTTHKAMEHWRVQHCAFVTKVFFKCIHSSELLEHEFRQYFNVGHHGKVPSLKAVSL